MGSATTASTKNFQRQREKAIQYAIGNPSIRRIADTVVASRNVNQNACQSMAINIASLEPEPECGAGAPARALHVATEMSEQKRAPTPHHITRYGSVNPYLRSDSPCSFARTYS